MSHVEIESIDALRARIKEQPALADVVLQGLDLVGLGAVFAGASLRRAILLGCKMDEALWRRCVDEGALVFPLIDSVPYDPYRSGLYTPEELFAGHVPGDAGAYWRCFDGLVYRHFVDQGSARPTDILEALAQRIHDHAITDAMDEYLGGKTRIVAVMGGHAMPRTDPTYRDVARLARDLTAEGFFMVSGGGPGAMEATHLGAWMCGRSDADLDAALALLAPAPLFKPIDAWIDTTLAVRERFPRVPMAGGALPESLGIPTWLYGHEPPSAFAPVIAKYFANSLREEGLVSVGAHGIVFAPGAAGTVQEIFQNATINHYVAAGGESPMILLGKAYWSEKLPVHQLLGALSSGRGYAAHVHLVETAGEAATILREFEVSRRK